VNNKHELNQITLHISTFCLQKGSFYCNLQMKAVTKP